MSVDKHNNPKEKKRKNEKQWQNEQDEKKKLKNLKAGVTLTWAIPYLPVHPRPKENRQFYIRNLFDNFPFFKHLKNETGKKKKNMKNENPLKDPFLKHDCSVLQKYLCDGELARHLNLQSARLTTYDLARKEAINYLLAKQTWTASGSADPMDLSPLGKGKGGWKGRGKGKADKSAKPKEWFYCGATTRASAGLHSPALKKKAVQPDTAGRYAGVEVDPETGKRKSSGGKETGAVNPARGLDAYVLHEDESDHDAYLFPLPMIGDSNDGPEDMMLCFTRCFLTREQQGQCAHQRSDQTSQLSRQKRSHCIKRTARDLCISFPSSSAWMLHSEKSKEGST